MSSNTAPKWRFGSRPKLSSKPTILCVDEDEELLRLRKGVLEEAGYAVLLANTGARALELLTDSHDIERRPPLLSAARKAVARQYGEAVASALCEVNPRAVVNDEPLPLDSAFKSF